MALPRGAFILLAVLAALAGRCCGQQDTLNLSPLECSKVVANYLSAQLPLVKASEPADKVVFFLHIPRTAGRTYNGCFLKQAHPPSMRCARSYDMLRYNISLETCKLITSHDDYSIMPQLPKDAVVISQLRDPVDRVMSAYEFTIEVAARGVKKPVKWEPPKLLPGRTDTRNVWPWSILVPWMEAQLRDRVQAASTQQFPPDTVLDPYDNVLAPSLREFVEHPVVQELLHDGGLLQVLGVTNYSTWPGHSEVRHCLFHDAASHRELLGFALERVSNFSHVGTTDRLYDSLTSWAGEFGYELYGPAYRAATPGAIKYVSADDGPFELPSDEQVAIKSKLREKRKEFDAIKARLETLNGVMRKATGADKAKMQRRMKGVMQRMQQLKTESNKLSKFLGTDSRGDAKSANSQQEKPDKDFVLSAPLWRAFRECEARTKKKQNSMKSKALAPIRLPDGTSYSFSKKARLSIPQDLKDLIRQMNKGDTALHKHAKQLLDAHMAALEASNRLEELPTVEHKPDGSVEERIPFQATNPKIKAYRIRRRKPAEKRRKHTRRRRSSR